MTSLLTSDGRHVVDPTEVGGVAVLANKTMMTTAVIEKFQDSHIAYLCPTWRTASTFNPIRCVAAKYNQST